MKFTKKKLILFVLLIALLAAYPVAKIVKWKMYIWLPDYIYQVVSEKPKVSGTKHIIFLFVDHYEPGFGERGVEKNREWLEKYKLLADQHKDSYGRVPQHSWFYAYDHKNEEVMKDLISFSKADYGEVELHWHHGNDTNEKFPAKLKEAVNWFNSFGALVSADGKVNFGFIHGNWTLDNSVKKEHCGVSRELDILKTAGCYADFTFPAFGTVAQPAKINSIYYAQDNDDSKSYNTGIDTAVGRPNKKDLMIFEGPLTLKCYDAIDEGLLPGNQSVDCWVDANIHVKGRPEWIFIKAHTHGAQSRRMFFNGVVDDMFSYLESKYGNGEYKLHYVNAREAYNIVRAAEDGKNGDPNLFVDYEIKKPVYKLN